MIFKKISLFFLFLTFLFSFSQAQVSMGIQFGESHFTEKREFEPDILSLPDEKYKSGFYVGLYAKFKIKNHWSIQPEVSFIEKGFGIKETSLVGAGTDPIEYKVKIVYNYIEMPILVKWEIPFGAKQHLEIGTGPSMGLLFGKRRHIFKKKDERTVSKSDYVLHVIDDNGDLSTTKEWRKIDAGLCIDLSYSCHLNTGNIKIGARTYIDFTSPAHSTYGSFGNENIKMNFTNRGFAFYLGYEIPLGKKGA